MFRFTCLLIAILILLPISAGAEGVQRFLLVGTDIQGSPVDVSADKAMSRADVILILAVKTGLPDIRVLNIERDYLVELPDGVGSNKLATSTYFGGPELLLTAVNELFDIDIHQFIQTDIESIPAIIDSIGGVDVEVFEEEVIVFGKTYFVEPVLFPGVNHLNGIQTRNFIRFRDDALDAVESNKQRNERHMRILSALADKAVLLSLKDTTNALEQISNLVETNISLYDLMLLLQKMSMPGKFMERLGFLNSPGGAYTIRQVKMHKVVVAENMEEEQRKVKDFLFYPAR